MSNEFTFIFLSMDKVQAITFLMCLFLSIGLIHRVNIEHIMWFERGCNSAFFLGGGGVCGEQMCVFFYAKENQNGIAEGGGLYISRYCFILPPQFDDWAAILIMCLFAEQEKLWQDRGYNLVLAFCHSCTIQKCFMWLWTSQSESPCELGNVVPTAIFSGPITNSSLEMMSFFITLLRERLDYGLEGRSESFTPDLMEIFTGL